MSTMNYDLGPFKALDADVVTITNTGNYWLLESEGTHALYLFPPSFNNGWGRRNTWRLIHLVHGNLVSPKTLAERLTIRTGSTVEDLWAYYAAYIMTGEL